MEDEDKLLYGDDGGGEKDDEPTQGGSGDTAQDEDTVTFPEEENAVRIFFFNFSVKIIQESFSRKFFNFTRWFFREIEMFQYFSRKKKKHKMSLRETKKTRRMTKIQMMIMYKLLLIKAKSKRPKRLRLLA